MTLVHDVFKRLLHTLANDFIHTAELFLSPPWIMTVTGTIHLQERFDTTLLRLIQAQVAKFFHSINQVLPAINRTLRAGRQ
uniref:hypothetical protein n=1 Tax=Trichocoleus desertorum TaxID=1481672 RepID=UPI0025B5CF15|nr:hypothetical protein [Trichocoleus desertorum]